MSDTLPEADAIPTPAPAADPSQLGASIDALLRFAKDKSSNPLEQMAVSYATQILGQHRAELVGWLGAITQGKTLSVRVLVDEAFAFAESKAQRLFVKYTLKGLNVLVDEVGLPLLQAYLLAHGIPLPLV